MIKIKVPSIIFTVFFVASVTGATFISNNKNTHKTIKLNSLSSLQKEIPNNLVKKTLEKTNNIYVPFSREVVSIKYGDSIFSILESFNLSNYEILEITKKIKSFNKNLLNLKENNIIRINKKNNKIHSVDLFEDEIKYTKVVLKNKNNREIIVYSDELPTVVKTKIIKGKISSSLYVDGLKAGLSDKLVVQLANVFAWDIDFSRDIAENDEFIVIFEEIYSGKDLLMTGDILASIFKTNKKDFHAFRFEDKNSIGFFNENGKNLEKAFIRSPVKFPRITSKFTMNRFHPVLKINRPHRGVDYGGSLNTPIMSTGSGKITFQGKKGGFGNVVMIDHKQGYNTLYAHMNKFNKKFSVGSYVKQGEIIGYMGRTGVATGVHLHYEMTVNNKHKDSLTLDLPDGRPVSDLDRFLNFKNNVLKQIEEEYSEQ